MRGLCLSQWIGIGSLNNRRTLISVLDAAGLFPATHMTAISHCLAI